MPKTVSVKRIKNRSFQGQSCVFLALRFHKELHYLVQGVNKQAEQVYRGQSQLYRGISSIWNSMTEKKESVYVSGLNLNVLTAEIQQDCI